MQQGLSNGTLSARLSVCPIISRRCAGFAALGRQCMRYRSSTAAAAAAARRSAANLSSVVLTAEMNTDLFRTCRLIKRIGLLLQCTAYCQLLDDCAVKGYIDTRSHYFSDPWFITMCSVHCSACLSSAQARLSCCCCQDDFWGRPYPADLAPTHIRVLMILLV